MSVLFLTLRNKDAASGQRGVMLFGFLSVFKRRKKRHLKIAATLNITRNGQKYDVNLYLIKTVGELLWFMRNKNMSGVKWEKISIIESFKQT